ncbi:MAG TPA: FtsX-like permease family protein [Streptosporangiaceae bacterium]
MTGRDWLLPPRLNSARLLVLSVLVSTVIAASLVAALAGFAARSLPDAVSRELSGSPRITVLIQGAFPAGQVRIDEPRVRAALRQAFGTVRFRTDQAVWSDPLALPGSPGPGAGGGQPVALTQAAVLTGIRSRVRLVRGHWPASQAAGRVAEAVAPASVAADLHIGLGKTVALRDRQTGGRVRVRLTGLYRPVNAAAPYWEVDQIGPSGVLVQKGFVTYGPLIVAPAAFRRGLPTGGVTWRVTPSVRSVGMGHLSELAVRVRRVLGALARSPALGGLQVASGLPAAFAGVAVQLVVARSLLLVGIIELLLLAGAALALTARTLTGQREEETALLTARGAGRWQLGRLALTEAVLLATAGTAIGVLAGGRLAMAVEATAGASLRESGPGGLAAGPVLAGGIPAQVWWTMALVLALGSAMLVWPAIRPVPPGQAKAGQGRRGAALAATRAGGDIALLVLAGLAVWQLRQYSVTGRVAGPLSVDPVLALAPAIALAAVTVLPLRVLPALARLADRLAARTSRLGLAMTSWQLSRRATRQSAPMLLVVLAVGAGTLALAQHQSWRRSAADQAAFAAGADVRADLIRPLPLSRSAAIARTRGVRAAMAVTTGLTTANGGQVLALDASRGPGTALLRADEAGGSPAALFGLLRPAATRAVPLPGRPERLELIASIGQDRGPGLQPVRVSVTVQDSAGIAYTVPAGRLADDGRMHRLTATLSASKQVSYPLRLLAVTAGFTLPPVPENRHSGAAAARVARFAVRGLAVSPAPSGLFPAPFATGAALAGWAPAVSAPGLSLAGVGIPPGLVAKRAGPGTVTFRPGYGQTSLYAPPLIPPLFPVLGQLALSAPGPRVIPAIATRAFLASNHIGVGSLYQVTAPGPATMTVRVVAAVPSFPTVTEPAGALIVDEAAAQDVAIAQSAPPLLVTQWWLATAGDAVPRGLPHGAVLTIRARVAGALLSDPMSVIPQQAVLAVAVAAALLAIVGFSVSLAGRVRERRSQAALLSALGVGDGAQVRQLAAEALALSAPAAVTGLLLGVALARLLVPAVTLTAAAAAPVPPVVVEVPWPAAVILAAAVTAIPVATAAAAALRRPEPAPELRAGETA